MTFDKMYPFIISRKLSVSILPPIDVLKYSFAESTPFSTPFINIKNPIALRINVNITNHTFLYSSYFHPLSLLFHRYSDKNQDSN